MAGEEAREVADGFIGIHVADHGERQRVGPHGFLGVGPQLIMGNLLHDSLLAKGHPAVAIRAEHAGKELEQSDLKEIVFALLELRQNLLANVLDLVRRESRTQ